MAKIDSLFKMMKQQGASDLHISTGAPPLFRLHGEMEKLNYPPLNDQQARGLLFEILIMRFIRLFRGLLEPWVDTMMLPRISSWNLPWTLGRRGRHSA